MKSHRPDQQRLCDDFNARFSVGTTVRVWPLARDDDSSSFVARTRSEAQVLSGHTAVVWVDGRPGCYALSHVESVDEGARAVAP